MRDNKVRLYAFLLEMGRISEDQVPEEYREDAVIMLRDKQESKRSGMA